MRPIDADALQTALVDEYSGISGHKTREKFYRAIEIVRQQPTIAPPPNDPLTLEQLREMDGAPVWCRVGFGQWGIINRFLDKIIFYNGGTLPLVEIQGRAYRRKPEGGK